MNLLALQSALADAVAGRADTADRRDLGPDEKERLYDVLSQPGMRVVQMLYRSWRLTKIVSLLPLTVASFDDEAIAGLLHRFWIRHPALGPYFVEECLAFLDFLAEEGVTAEGVRGDLVGFERARLEMRTDLAGGAAEASRSVVFEHDPIAVLGSVGTDDPAAVPERERVVLAGQIGEDGHERWVIASGERSGTVLHLGSS